MVFLYFLKNIFFGENVVGGNPDKIFYNTKQLIPVRQTMERKLLLQEDGNKQEVKEISMSQDAQNLKMIVGKLSWKILRMLSEEEMYPLEIARRLGIHEQKVYYHVRKLAKAGAITLKDRKKRKGQWRNITRQSHQPSE